MTRDTIWKAVRRGDLNAVRNFVARDGLPKTHDDFKNQSLLTVACEAGHLPVVQFLLELRGERSSRYSPEAFAAMRAGHLAVLQLLCAYGLDANAVDISIRGHSLFQEAVKSRNAEVVRLLLAHDAMFGTGYPLLLEEEMTEEEVEGENYPSVIELASRRGDMELTRFLIDAGVT